MKKNMKWCMLGEQSTPNVTYKTIGSEVTFIIQDWDIRGYYKKFHENTSLKDKANINHCIRKQHKASQLTTSNTWFTNIFHIACSSDALTSKNVLDFEKVERRAASMIKAQ